MADVKTVDEGTDFPEKRKLDLPTSITTAPEEGKDKADSNKKQKIEIPSEGNCSASLAGRETAAESEELPKVNADAAEVEDEEDDEDEEEYNAEQDEDDGDEEAESVDRKGKGIMKDDKGKGKMIEGFNDDDSDDEDDSSGDSDSGVSDGVDEGESEDDLLAEVDLGNILPSRTRQRQVQRGLRMASDSDKGKNA